MTISHVLLALWFAPLMGFAQVIENSKTPVLPSPKLSGQHFRISVVESSNNTNVQQDEETGEITYSGYLIDILREIAREDRANFTYEILPPSGFGSGCGPGRLNYTHGSDKAYSPDFRLFWSCAESDVNDRPKTNYTTDMYWGKYGTMPVASTAKQMFPHS